MEIHEKKDPDSNKIDGLNTINNYSIYNNVFNPSILFESGYFFFGISI